MIFASWRHNLSDSSKTERVGRLRNRKHKRAKSFPSENYFASWRHNLESRNRNISPEKSCSPENYFSAWRINLDPMSSVLSPSDSEDGEDIFGDWIPNLWEIEEEDPEFQPDDHRLIKNKKRIQRKSHNLKRKRHF